jgi:hypothetical protein
MRAITDFIGVSFIENLKLEETWEKFDEECSNSIQIGRQPRDCGLEILGLSKTDLETINKTDWRKAMSVRSIRKHRSVKLEGIAKELHMGVRSGVTRADQMLKILLKDQKTVQKMWRNMEMMQHFSA